MNIEAKLYHVVSEYIGREVSLGQLIPIPRGCKAIVQTSPIGLIQKKHKPGQFRMIVDLSSPKSRSVNDGVDSVASSVAYTSIDHLATLIGVEDRVMFLDKSRCKRSI